MSSPTGNSGETIEDPRHMELDPHAKAPPTSPVAPGAEALPISTDAEGRLDLDLPCRTCGYNLRGMQPDGNCPECGLEISKSIRGDLLRYQDPAWVARLARGANLAGIGLVCSIAVSFLGSIAVMFVFAAAVGMTIEAGLVAGIAGLLTIGATVPIVLGGWYLTSPEPARVEAERGMTVRRTARWCLLALFIAAPLNLLQGWGNSAAQLTITTSTGLAATASAASTVMQIVVFIGMVAGLILLRRLAQRVPAYGLARQTSIVLCGYGLATLIAIVLEAVLTAATLIVMPAMINAPPPGSNAAPAGGAAGMLPPAGLLAVLVVGGIGTCAGRLLGFIFGIWAIVLVFLYAGTFRRQAELAHAQ